MGVGMRVLLPAVLTVAVLAGAGQAQVTGPDTIAPQGPVSQAPNPRGFVNSVPTVSPVQEVTPQPSGSGQSQPNAGKPGRKTMRQRFDEANVTHDGHLTAEQAQAGGLRFVARHFAEIDKDNRGYVTFDQIRAYRREHRRQNGVVAPGAPGSEGGAGAPAGEQPGQR